MKRILIVFAAFCMSCGNSVKNNPTEDAEGTTEKTVETNELEEQMIIGKFDKNDLEKEPYTEWYSSNYESFEPEAESFQIIDEHINDYEIKIFMGTWCSDSKREVPKMIKILEKTDYDFDQLEMIAVDRNKTTPAQLEKQYDVSYVPTIIFLKDGKEVNRFVEYSVAENMEEDIAKIVSGQEYENPYTE